MQKKKVRWSNIIGPILLILAVVLGIVAYGIGIPQEVPSGSCIHVDTASLCNNGVITLDGTPTAVVITTKGMNGDIRDEEMHFPYWNLWFQRLGGRVYVWSIFTEGIVTP